VPEVEAITSITPTHVAMLAAPIATALSGYWIAMLKYRDRAIDKQDERIDKLFTRLDLARAAIEQRDKENEQLRERKDREIDALREQMHVLDRDKSTADIEVDRLRERVKDLEKRLEEAEEETVDLLERIERIRALGCWRSTCKEREVVDDTDLNELLSEGDDVDAEEDE